MELKHCPYCGGRPELRKKGKRFFYECGGCWTQTRKHETPEEAAEEWNKLLPEERGWKRVTCCPYCGGALEISAHFTFSMDHRLTKAGKLSKRYRRSEPGFMDCITAFCLDCERAFDADEVTVESDGTIWLKVQEA